MARIYVETVIDAPLDDLWAATQDPAVHARWDLRFGRITPIPGSSPAAFTYATATIAGFGVHSGSRSRSSSALRFGSDDVRSPIRAGSGYWRYVPAGDGVRFLTGYAYETRWGRFGRAFDLVFGPLFGWATAWSFDRLRLWLVHGVTPERARRRFLTELLLRASLAGAAAVTGRPLLLLLAVVLAVAMPPRPLTPAARRCLRRPRSGGSRVAPLAEAAPRRLMREER